MKLTKRQAILEAAERIGAMESNAYFSYIACCRQNECLGFDAKAEIGKFGRAELDAHNKAHEWLGKHRAYHDAASLLRAMADAIEGE